jgi:hypothetical protein
MGNSFLDEFPVIPLHEFSAILYQPQRLKARESALIGVLPVFYWVEMDRRAMICIVI